jgi:Zn-dependent metalloprotease
MIQTLSWCRVLTLCTTLFLFYTAKSQKTPQQIDDLRKKVLSDPKVAAVGISEERQTPSLIVFKSNSGYSKDQASLALRNYLDLRGGTDDLIAAKTATLNGGLEVVEFQQYYKGIKVEHARFKALVKNGVVQFFNGAYFEVPATIGAQPSINEAGALSFAKARVGAKKYAWEDVQEKLSKATNATVKDALQKELADITPKGELVIVKDFTKAGVAQTRLAYKFNIYAAEPLSRAWIYVDAQNGKILLTDKIIKHVDNPAPPASVSATVQTRYAGTQTIKTKFISGNDPNSGLPLVSSHPTTEPTYIPGAGTYVLIDDTRGNGIETYDMNGVGGLPLSVPSLYIQGKSFTDADNNWTYAEHHRSLANDGALEAENDDIAWDAHWGAEVVYDYWLAKHNRQSYDGKNAKIKNFIHYGPAYDNAFWNGTAMTYGDGSGPAASGFKALTSLDVCGHEIGHGVCSFTADLVYANESGAMNEGLSDIWAACIEHFAMRRSGSTVPATAYRPFYIGEQIGATVNNPLRRMDNPKVIGDPDTYGGANWKDPNCTPSLANDQCGVHTNSGVLNHWFFLLTAGSKNGTRPAGMTSNQYYFADSDDEINDLGNAYTVNGVGFDVSENITFLMETMLTATATYAEAREVSIQVAQAVSGDPCSAMVESVTNAWYAVGVGGKFVKPCTVKYGFIYQPGLTVSESSNTQGCNATRTINIPVLLPAGGTATVTVSGTATQGADYTLSATSISNTGTTSAKKELVVTVKNDGIVERDEMINLKLAITNVGTNPVNSGYVITITDDDVTPIIGSNAITLLNETFTRENGFEDPTNWKEILQFAETNGDPLATGKNQWGIFDNQLAITGKEGLTNTKLANGTYNSSSESNTIIRSPLLDARGLSLINVKFDFTVQGEVDPASGSTDIENLPVFDYMAVMYSLDGVNFTELNTGDFKQFASATPYSGSFSGLLPASLSNKQFYLAFRWSNDANAGGPVSVKIDNLLVNGSPRKIENDLNQNGRENLGAGYDVYFYSLQDGEVLGRVKNGYTKDFGCTNLFVEKTGTGAFNLYQGKDGLHKVADKIVRIETSLIYKAPTTVALYYTEAQLQALENATGQKRTAFSVYQVYAAAYTGASSTTTKRYAAVYTAIPGVGGYYTISFTDKANGSYALGYPVSVIGATTQASGRTPQENVATTWQFGNIYPNPGRGVASVTVTSPTAQRVVVEVINVSGQVLMSRSEQVNTGMNRLNLPVDRIGTGSYMIRFTDAEGKTLNTQPYTRN